MTAELLEKSILELVPPVPYVVDQVDAAMKWVKEEKEEGEYLKALRTALKVAEYAAKVSNPNFYKTHLIVASLLSNVADPINNEKFKIFDTASKSVEKALKSITIDPKLQEEKGCFKALILQIVPLLKVEQDYVVIMLCGILEDLEEISRVMHKAGVKSPITREDYVILLGYSMVITSLYQSKQNILNDTATVLNDIQIILNNLSF